MANGLRKRTSRVIGGRLAGDRSRRRGGQAFVHDLIAMKTVYRLRRAALYCAKPVETGIKWKAPMDTRGLATDMVGPGERPEIGPITDIRRFIPSTAKSRCFYDAGQCRIVYAFSEGGGRVSKAAPPIKRVSDWAHSHFSIWPQW